MATPVTSPTKAVMNTGMGTLAPAFGSTYSGLRQELLKTVLHGKPEVIDKFLGAGDPNVSADRSILETICAEVVSLCGDDIDTVRKVSDDSRKNKREKALYEPLGNLFATIEKVCAQSSFFGARSQWRQALINSERSLLLDEYQYPDVRSKPDFIITEVEPPKHGNRLDNRLPADRARWRQCPGFIEVKASPGELPTNRGSTDASLTLAQAADYARLILAARPFQLSAYGVLFCGHCFALALFDRRGILVSPGYSILESEGLEIFVRIVLRFTWDASDVDLGHDPTVSLLEGSAYYKVEYPRFAVKMGDSPDAVVLKTVGLPLWVSFSLLGRGTHVWSATGFPNEDTSSILKMSWRSEYRDSESRKYEQIRRLYSDRRQNIPRGIARFCAGWDVVHGARPLSVYSLRQFGLKDGLDPGALCVPGVSDAVLHRVVLADVGEPLWRYTDAAELALVLRMVVQTHQTLCADGILHRDISAGNILIRTVPSWEVCTDSEDITMGQECTSPEGFLSDFELASIATAVTAQGENFKPAARSVASLTRSRHDGLSGTPIFMACSLLNHLSNQAKSGKDLVYIRREAHHDVESFGWVIIYVVYRHTLDSGKLDSGEYEVLREEFKRLYSGDSFQSLWARREAAIMRRDADDMSGIEKLTYFLEQKEGCRPLSLFLTLVWTLLKQCPGREDAPDDPVEGDAWKEKMISMRKKWRAEKGMEAMFHRGERMTHEQLLDAIDMLLSALKHDEL
ncbi:hypothetical protein C8Q78DRAFT_1083102 [Trametes maxima]|nr:hypothetical protein C8Q78DRAFT_1083102 [Trametes maxima]